jgi:hypothetical protein
VAKFDLKAYARHGAAARVAELNEELTAIYRVFPIYVRARRRVMRSPSVSVVE